MTKPEHMIDGPGMAPVVAEPGMRVARWHQAYAEEFDPIPGTILRVGAKYLTVEFDGLAGGPTSVRRVEPRNVTPWSEPRE